MRFTILKRGASIQKPLKWLIHFAHVDSLHTQQTTLSPSMKAGQNGTMTICSLCAKTVTFQKPESRDGKNQSSGRFGRFWRR